jgi:argininosuccinate synthase
VLSRELLRLRREVAAPFAEMCDGGMWYSDAREALSAFYTHAQRYLAGEVTLGMYRGNLTVTSITSPYSLFQGSGEQPEAHADNAAAARGYVHVVDQPIRMWSQRHRAVGRDSVTRSIPLPPEEPA